MVKKVLEVNLIKNNLRCVSRIFRFLVGAYMALGVVVFLSF